MGTGERDTPDIVFPQIAGHLQPNSGGIVKILLKGRIIVVDL
jgi:hypothetical protein